MACKGRDVIKAHNLSLLRQAAPTWTGTQIEDTYERVFARIEAAMAGALLGDDFARVLALPSSATDQARALFKSKRLTRATLRQLLGDLDDPTILSEISDPEALRTTQLERKLWRAGATEAIVHDAKQLRANAVRRELEIAATSLTDQTSRLADVQQRLLVIANSAAAVVDMTPPGPHVWAKARTEIDAARGTADPRSLFGKDAMLLLGELCEVSDQCRFGWTASAGQGLPDAA